MKISNIESWASHAADISKGRVGNLGGSDGEPPSIDYYNNTGGTLPAGTVVVIDATGSIVTTTTVADPRPTGVVLADVADGDSVAVAFSGPVDLVLVTASVTAGDYGQTSAVAGQAQDGGATRTAASFVQFTSSGTTPSGFLLFGGGGSTGTGAAEPVFDHGNMGATETLDLADGTWHRGTLDADCTITVTGFTVDEGLVVVFEVTQDGTGNWSITWDPDVLFLGDDQPDTTASTTTVFLLFSSAGDSAIFGVRVGTGTSVGSLDDLSDVTLTSPASADRLRYDGSVWRNSALIWTPLTVYDGTTWLPLVDGDGNQLMAEA